jgi:hypothetical protein
LRGGRVEQELTEEFQYHLERTIDEYVASGMLQQDVIYALRGLRKNPGFSVVAILSLAVGIGATTTIFTFVDTVFLRPLPYPASERLAVLHEHELTSRDPLNVHPANFVEWRRRARSFEALALVQAPPLNVIGSSGAEQISRFLTTSDLFRVFGVSPVPPADRSGLHSCSTFRTDPAAARAPHRMGAAGRSVGRSRVSSAFDASHRP